MHIRPNFLDATPETRAPKSREAYRPWQRRIRGAA